jgi:hypothetical protein
VLVKLREPGEHERLEFFHLPARQVGVSVGELRYEAPAEVFCGRAPDLVEPVTVSQPDRDKLRGDGRPAKVPASAMCRPRLSAWG